MSLAKNKWLDAASDWFEAHPEREFRITEIPIASLAAMTSAGSLVGIASQPSESGAQVTASVSEGSLAVPCVIRRADPASGRFLPSVFLMDGDAPLPPAPKAVDPSRSQEMLATEIWRLAQIANARGVSLIHLLLPGLART